MQKTFANCYNFLYRKEQYNLYLSACFKKWLTTMRKRRPRRGNRIWPLIRRSTRRWTKPCSTRPSTEITKAQLSPRNHRKEVGSRCNLKMMPKKILVPKFSIGVGQGLVIKRIILTRISSSHPKSAIMILQRKNKWVRHTKRCPLLRWRCSRHRWHDFITKLLTNGKHTLISLF